MVSRPTYKTNGVFNFDIVSVHRVDLRVFLTKSVKTRTTVVTVPSDVCDLPLTAVGTDDIEKVLVLLLLEDLVLPSKTLRVSGSLRTVVGSFPYPSPPSS